MIEYRRGDVGLDYRAFRKGVSDCPFCDFEEVILARKGKPKTIGWFDSSQVRAVHFIDDGNFYKKGQVIIDSECPECFKNSFHHWGLESLLYEDWIDKEKVEAEIQRLQLITLAEWDSSLCKRCSVPKKLDMTPFGFRVDCGGRMGPPQQPDEEPPFLCTSFKEAKKK